VPNESLPPAAPADAPPFDLAAYLAEQLPHLSVACHVEGRAEERDASGAVVRPAVRPRRLPNPATGAPVVLSLYASESAEARAAQLRYLAASEPLEAAKDFLGMDAADLRLAAECTAGWDLPTPYTIEGGVRLYTALRWVRDLADATLAEERRFFVAPVPDSSATPPTSTG